MKTLIAIAADVSAKAYAGTLPGGPVALAPHEFTARPDGQLEHRINGVLRAVVPPEGLEAYVDQWPDCAPVVKTLKGAEASAKKTAAAPKKPGKRK